MRQMRLYLAYYQGKRYGGVYTMKQMRKVNDKLTGIEWVEA